LNKKIAEVGLIREPCPLSESRDYPQWWYMETMVGLIYFTLKVLFSHVAERLWDMKMLSLLSDELI
jgi:hypothetical protein